MSDPAVELNGVWFSYGGEPVLEDVNLSIADREFVSIVGPNGGGKTTLVKIMLGLLKPDRGTVRIYGRAPHRMRGRMGYVPQTISADPKFPATALDVVLMGRLSFRARFNPATTAHRAKALDALEAMDLLARAGRPYSQLSGGQRRRVLIARAMVSEPDIILLDEPTAGLDPGMEQQLYELLREMNRRIALIVVSHDLWFVSRFVNNVVCVRREVHTHPTGEISEQAIGELCGLDMRMVRHDRHTLREVDP